MSDLRVHCLHSKMRLESTVATLTSEIARLRGLLGEFMTDAENEDKPTRYDAYFYCSFCDEEKPGHTADCLMTRTRAALDQPTQ